MGKKADSDSLYSLNYSRCMLSALQNFRQNETMLDVTLVCHGKSLKAHKLVLASISQMFKQIISDNPCEHPIIIFRDCEFEDLKAIIDFIYKGHLSVPKERLMSTLKLAEEFNIRGLISNENSEKYKSLYGQICGKVSNRKKRKRQRHNSKDSEESDYVKISDSDQNMESNADNVALFESRMSDVETVFTEENIENEKDVRPLVLHVGDLSTSNEESMPQDEMHEGASIEINLAEKILSVDDVLIESSSVPKEDAEVEIYEITAENTELGSQFDAYAAYSENSNLQCAADEEQNNSQDQSMEPVSGELEKQPVFTSLSPKSSQQDEETRSPDEGKRSQVHLTKVSKVKNLSFTETQLPLADSFDVIVEQREPRTCFICSKCDSVFTSRINFMRHKTLGHNNEKSSQCQFCAFTTEDMDILKQHLLTHTDSVPYKCSTCSKEFTSEDVYQKHVSVHEVEEIVLPGSSAIAGKDLFSSPNTNQEFRCSICFVKFFSKLRCQLHEKSCQGAS